jgi:hypothetical protein
MGFAWEFANVRNFGMPDVWEYPPLSPRHRKPPRRAVGDVTALAHRTAAAVAMAARRAKAALAARRALADHRRAF